MIISQSGSAMTAVTNFLAARLLINDEATGRSDMVSEFIIEPEIEL